MGLKGTDDVVERAIAAGAKPVARAIYFLKRVKDLGVGRRISLITCPNPMGEEEVESVGLEAKVY